MAQHKRPLTASRPWTKIFPSKSEKTPQETLSQSKDPRTIEQAYGNLVAAMVKLSVQDVLKGIDNEKHMAVVEKDKKRRRAKLKKVAVRFRRSYEIRIMTERFRRVLKAKRKAYRAEHKKPLRRISAPYPRNAQGYIKPTSRPRDFIALNASHWRKDAADAEGFLAGGWFTALTGHDGRPILNRLKNDCNFRQDLRRRFDDADGKRKKRRPKL